jgi:antirestriction protein ArdC
MYYNFYTNKEYTGKNLDLLEATGLTGAFLTFNQARKLKGQVRKGSKCVARLTRFIDKKLSQKTDQLENGFCSYPVFHISQIDFKEEQNDS